MDRFDNHGHHDHYHYGQRHTYGGMFTILSVVVTSGDCDEYNLQDAPYGLIQICLRLKLGLPDWRFGMWM
jgi:hypothetical protein